VPQTKLNWFGNSKKKRSKNTSKKKRSKGTKIKKKSKKLWRNKGKAVRRSIQATQRTSKAVANLGYAAPSPIQIFTYAWHKTSRSLKTLITLVFALAILFIPIGIFYYVGWAVAAAGMFLVSLIYWIFSNAFFGIAQGLVALINGIASLFLGMVVYVVEAIFSVLNLGTWENGRHLLENSLINYDQIANVPSLYEIVKPGWENWMNESLLSKIIEILGFDTNFSMFSDQFEAFYLALSPTQAVIIGLVIILIPIVYLAAVYYRNRSRIYS
jgi:hypothetical protein